MLFRTLRKLFVGIQIAGMTSLLFPAILFAATYTDVQTIFQQKCVICHSGETAAASLRLNDLAGIQAGGANGPVVMAGEAKNSVLVKRIKGETQPRMPMTGPPYLSHQEIDLIERWIDEGLKPGQVASEAPGTPVTTKLPAPGALVSYRDVAPIFARHCVKCHSEQGLMGAAPEGYLLNSYAETISASDRARVVPGNPAASELIRKLRGQSSPRMPLDGPPYLSKNEITLIERWILQGASDSMGQPAKPVNGAKVRLHGKFKANGYLDDLKVTVTSRTRIKKKTSVGDYVQLRGRLDSQGNVIADRIRRR